MLLLNLYVLVKVVVWLLLEMVVLGIMIVVEWLLLRENVFFFLKVRVRELVLFFRYRLGVILRDL